MAAMVDFCPPQAMQATAAPAADAAEFSCAACAEVLTSAAALRAHHKSERHVYNTKRKLAGLKPISQDAWERKISESRAIEAGANKGKSHLKAGKDRKSSDAASNTQAGYPSTDSGTAPSIPSAPEEEVQPFTPRRSLFDRQHFTTLEKNLAHMWRTYNFYIPDREYCNNVEGLLEHLWQKCNQEYACLFCNRRFPDAASTRRHMLDKKHARIGVEARTRRGNPDEQGSRELQAEIEDFYDFTGSTREITEKITDPEQRIASILRYFDEDRDGCLCHEEVSALWKAASDSSEELSEAAYLGACSTAGADPWKGLDVEALGKLYAEGFADLDEHFGVLQDILAKKLARKGKHDKKEIKEEEAEGEGEQEDEDGDSEDDDSSGTEIVECDDEEEFEEVMRVLGMVSASVLDNGDLRLPNGMIAANRDVAHIWRQRGTRLTGQMALAGAGRPGAGKSARSVLMLSNDPHGVAKAELTQRQQKREGKKMIAVLREKNRQEMRLGLKMNVIIKGKPQKYKTLVGDASGGR
eukprot:TRINITY_DN46688_c0_g1_i1.p1 TRINITY_DN46688_c0_g1~~TRINITY_DN46688_c0_g1_i1.p1  ORF type:complete len:525 (+),score=142.30 TRINITY_DN46688_c0_g1_i1:114-1688(+)